MTITLDEQTLFEQLLRSPRLPIVARKIEAVLENESRQRNAFYNQISEGDKAEYINGEVIFHSPVKLRHNNVSGHLYRLLSTYVMMAGSGYVGYEKISIALSRNDYEPDICYFGVEKSAQFRADQMRFPAPDFVVEVLSDSTAENDRGIKFLDYAAHGVPEYWIIDPEVQVVEQYRLTTSSAGQHEYELALKAADGTITSIVLPDFQIPVRAIFDEEVTRETLRTIVALQRVV